MATIYFFNAASQKWEPINTGGGTSSTPGPQGPKGDKGDKGDGIAVVVQATQPANAELGTVWINPNP